MGVAAERAAGPPDAGAAGRPWRILFAITSSDVGGAENIVLETVTRLDRREFAPTLCSLRAPGRVAAAIAATGAPVATFGMNERPRLGQMLAGARRLARRMDALGIDLVHSFLYRANVLARLAARLSRRRPVVVSGQHSLRPLTGRSAALVSRCTRSLSDRIVVCSRAVGEELVRAEGVRPERLVLIENGVDTERYRPAPDGSLRATLGLPAGACVVGSVGRLSAEKGLDALVEGVGCARRQAAPVELLLAGDGPERPALEARARALGIGAAVRFLGQLRDPLPVYGALDVFALPSLHEASPMALLEAMACGCAVVASAVGGVPEVVEAGRSGVLVPPHAPAALGDALVRLAADPALRQRLGAEARGRVLERFAVTRMVEEHARLYRELLRARA